MDATQELVDSHCHIQSIGLSEGVEASTRELWAKSDLTSDQVLANALEYNVSRLICVGCDYQDSCLAVDFAAKHDNCWAAIGIHPHEAKSFFDSGSSPSLAKFASLVVQPKVVAVGECGLDYYYQHSPKAQQIKALKFQLELAVSADLPLIFHVRQAFDDFWPILDEYKGVRGVLHSFTDSADNLNQAIARGLHIGVNGIATFTKDSSQHEVYKSIPLTKLLLETDSPFLTPAPYRGSINEPKHVSTVAKFMAKLRQEDLAVLSSSTTANARKLFGI